MRGFMRGFGNRIIAHANYHVIKKTEPLRVLETATALDAAQHDSKESLKDHNKQL